MATKAQKAEKQQLKSAQKAEIKALKYSGASKSGIKAEKQANKTEFKSLLSAQKSGTYTTPSSLVGLRSEASTWGNSAYAPQVQNLLDSAAQNYVDYNIPTVSKSGKVTTGVGLDKLVDYEAGRTGEGFNKLMNNAQQYVGKTFNLVDLANQGVNLKEVKGSPGVFKAGSGGNLTLFSQNPDGTYTGTGINQIRKEDGGVFDSTLGKIALGIGAFYLGPMAGQLMGLSGGLGGAVGGGLLGGGASVLGGGKFLPGAVVGATGGFAGGGGLSGMLGTELQPGAPIYEAGTGNLISAGETIPGAVTGTGQSLGSFGQLGMADLSQYPLSQTIVPGTEATLGTAGFGTALRPASALAADLVAGGMSAGTAANIAGLTAAGTGATNLLGGATAFAPVAAPTLWQSIKNLIPSMPSGVTGLLPSGLGSMLPGLLNQPEEMAAGGGGFAGANADYSALLAALSAPRIQPRSLV